MYFQPEATPEELKSLLSRFKTLVGWQHLKRRFDSLEASRNGFYRQYLENHFKTEISLLEIYKYISYTGRTPWPPTPDQLRVYSFIAFVCKLHKRLTPAGQNKLIGSIRNCLRQDYGLGPVVFEMKTAVNLLQAGFNVHFSDMEGEERYDFLAEKNGKELEVECKHISTDLGRKIHQKKLYQFANYLKPFLQNRTVIKNTIAHIQLEDRLNTTLYPALTDCLLSALSSNVSVKGSGFNIKVEHFSHSESPFHLKVIDENAIRSWIEKKLAVSHVHAFASYRPNSSAFVVAVESQKPDQVLQKILKNVLSASKSQLTQKKPGFVSCFLADLSEKQLIELQQAQNKEPTGLQIVANKILDKRPNLHSLSFTTDGNLLKREGTIKGLYTTSYQEQGSAYYFYNETHPLANDIDLQVYRKVGVPIR